MSDKVRAVTPRFESDNMLPFDCPTPVAHGHVGKAPEVELHSCGYPEDTFACKIRHIHMNTGDAKAGGVRPPPGERRTVEITPSGRIIR